MSRTGRRRLARLAEHRFACELDGWRASAGTLRTRLAAHRTRLLIGGGLVAGIALDRLPLRTISAVAGMCISAVSFVLRLPVGVLLAGGAAAGAQAATTAPTSARDSSA